MNYAKIIILHIYVKNNKYTWTMKFEWNDFCYTILWTFIAVRFFLSLFAYQINFEYASDLIVLLAKFGYIPTVIAWNRNAIIDLYVIGI